MKNKNRLTYIEMVLLIISLSVICLFVSTKVSSLTFETKKENIQRDFHAYQISNEKYLREMKGEHFTIEGLNHYLDQQHQIEEKGEELYTKKKDSWGYPYQVEIGVKRVVVRTHEGTYQTITYYHKGFSDSCTIGFDSEDKKLTLLRVLPVHFQCGDEMKVKE